MNVAIMQRDVIWAEPKANCERANHSIATLPADTDLIVFPEMFSTGFAIRPEGIAEPEQSDTLMWMHRVAVQYDCAVAGSIAVQTGQTFRNRFYFVTPDGAEAHYDKHHLFTYGGEPQYYTAGQERVVVEWRGVRFLLQVCYDLRFPLWSRNREDYDCALYVANWPTSRIGAWNTLLRARAIENQCYAVGVNRVGQDPTCQYCGASAVIDPYGHDLATCPFDQETESVAYIDMEALRAFRHKFPVLRDRDDSYVKMFT